MSTAVKYLQLLFLNFRLNLSSAMEYRFSFWSQVLFMMLNNVFLLFFWWVFFANFPMVEGWQLKDVMLLNALGAGSYGVAAMMAGNSQKMGEIVAKGELDYYLLLPVDPLFNVITSRMSVAAVGDLAFAVILAGLVLKNPISLLFFLLLILCGALTLAAFWSMAGCLSFFWGQSEGFSSLIREAILTFSLYPEYIFTGALRFMLFTLIPAAFVAHVPLALLRAFTWGRLGLLLLGVLAISLLARAVFAWGLKKYESGNLMVTRL